MAKRIVIIQGHPDPAGARLCHALADAYAKGAEAAGHEVRRIAVAALDFPLLRTQADFMEGEPPAAIAEAQETLRWSEHLLIVYPLWLGTMPALLKGFFEQTMRPGFAFSYESKGWPKKQLSGRSARIVVTMGMPAILYRWFFMAHSLRSLERNILRFVGIKPVRDTIFGMVEGMNEGQQRSLLAKMTELGRTAR